MTKNLRVEGVEVSEVLCQAVTFFSTSVKPSQHHSYVAGQQLGLSSGCCCLMGPVRLCPGLAPWGTPRLVGTESSWLHVLPNLSRASLCCHSSCLCHRHPAVLPWLCLWISHISWCFWSWFVPSVLSSFCAPARGNSATQQPMPPSEQDPPLGQDRKIPRTL